ncbi:hypothetical protein [uncultured Aquabacterium sp.]|uniref:hypothetical protein n=1 Tax=uncultured Aquabacterium sp. TaxID=158753 RepID=UPI0025D42541|nr:hypothetical protein [uncultured Aquabacterium sp.]
MFRLTFINAKAERITRFVPAENLNAAIDSAFDNDGAQFLTIKKVSPDACPDHA